MGEHDARDTQDSLRCLVSPWRTGGSVGRTVYAIVSQAGPPMAHAREETSVLIGLFDTAQLAEAAVTAHNDWLRNG